MSKSHVEQLHAPPPYSLSCDHRDNLWHRLSLDEYSFRAGSSHTLGATCEPSQKISTTGHKLRELQGFESQQSGRTLVVAGVKEGNGPGFVGLFGCI